MRLGESGGSLPLSEFLWRDDQRRDHTEHALRAFSVTQNVTVPCPHAWIGCFVQHGVALSRCDPNGVGRLRHKQWHAVLSDDPTNRLMHVHRVAHETFVLIVDHHDLPKAHGVWLGCGEGLSIE